jgi:hypothetical protein
MAQDIEMKSSDAKEETKKEEKPANEAHAATTQTLTVIEGKFTPMFFMLWFWLTP